ncbi:MAG: tRNA (N6-threonylcarbamoyladenosine(37)-N6)-methyltransferase TrmO [Bacilli bacterium]|jgi:tRNA-Thr(GGU) m(6)t(6)A37 methyltransferase TsaA|nr:tRNA (N6-threonylcarbamoyladenosine(37)-N6)-methyltransferase TrmO [Bacilli bacterium]
MIFEENTPMDMVIHPIAYMLSPFPDKFGIPRQADLVKEIKGTIVFEPAYRKEGILKGMEAFSHLWLIWGFSESPRNEWSPLVRPPKLGGNETRGVFATRSPIRPNPLGLSAVKIIAIRNDPKLGMVIDVSGNDLMDKTPIFDIKPYLPYADAIPEALQGFAPDPAPTLEPVIPPPWDLKIPVIEIPAVKAILAQDPRPGYQHDETREYGFYYQGLNIRFKVEDEKRIVVTDVEPILPDKKGMLKTPSH